MPGGGRRPGSAGWDALRGLAVALEDEDPQVRRQTVWCSAGRSALRRSLSRSWCWAPPCEVRLAAAKALQVLGGPARDALPALEHARGDPDEGVASAARSALAAIDSRPYGKPLRHWVAKLGHPRPKVRRT